MLPGVTVTAVCTETNLTRTAVTDAQGGFTLPELPVCLYRVTAELPGFKTVAREAPVVANAVAKVDFRLEVGALSETVTVEGVSPLIEFSDKLNNRVDSEAHRGDAAQRPRFQFAAQRHRRASSTGRAAASRASTSAARGPRRTTS